MGGSHSNTATINQQFMNRITTENQDNCVANSNVTVSGNVIIISGGTVSGNVGTVAGTSTDASCLMVSEMQNSIQDIMRATSTQTNNTSNDLFGDFSWTNDTNTFNLTQSVTNNISQINQTTCTANSMVTNSNNYIYLPGTAVGGNVGFVADGTQGGTTANCSMSNMMKNYTYNYVQGENNQGNTQKGMFIAIVAAICSLIGIIIIGVVILFAVGAVGYTGYELVRPKTAAGAAGPGDDISSELASLGLTSDDITGLDNQVAGALPQIGNIRPIAPASPVITPLPAGGSAPVPARPTGELASAASSFLDSTKQQISTKATALQGNATQKLEEAGNKISQQASKVGAGVSQKAEHFASKLIGSSSK